jgi:uncharacterized protein with HEPN domain
VERSSIGEAVLALSRVDAAAFEAITQARRIVNVRKQLTHAYASINDSFVRSAAAPQRLAATGGSW